jgi:hypothetical protein
MAEPLFYMWESFREHLIARHNFYIIQARKRLLSQFQNMDTEVHVYGEKWINRKIQYFDPDRHDPASLYEQANDESVELYLMLDEMLSKTRLSVVGGIYHEWDKQLRSWIVKEINHWHSGEEVKKAIWKANSGMIFDLLEGFGWSIRSKRYFQSLERCRLVVNTFKHGDGDAMDIIKQKHPEFIDSLESNNPIFLDNADYTCLKIEENNIDEFSNAIVEFWNDVPQYIFDNEKLNLPTWLEKAFKKDF